VRDFLYVDDMVEVCRRFVALPDDRGTYNVGSGCGHSLNEVRAIVERICGCPLRMAYGPARGVDMRHAVLDITRLQRRLSWKPAVMLEEGIRATWKWLRED
jgi:UDP-glucose 4-epimerase